MERVSTLGRKYTIPMFRTGVLLDRSITNVAIVFHESAECEDTCRSDEDHGDGHSVKVSHVMAVRSKLEESKQMVMDDTFVQPCLQESEDWPRLYHDIEVQRERLEEMAWFEREVDARTNARKSVANWSKDHAGDIAGLSAHDSPPRLLRQDDLTDGDVLRLSKTHREKVGPTGMLPMSVLVAKPVSRSEFIDNPKAMETYWKEWNNLESKEVRKWETLTEWDTVAEKARTTGEEIHFGYLFGIMVE